MRQPTTPPRPGRARPEPRPPKIAVTETKAETPRRPPLVQRAGPGVAPEERQRLIAELAYGIAERRGFGPGNELNDWLQAEAEIDRRLDGGGGD
jgi:hypothetical protein